MISSSSLTALPEQTLTEVEVLKDTGPIICSGSGDDKVGHHCPTFGSAGTKYSLGWGVGMSIMGMIGGLVVLHGL